MRGRFRFTQEERITDPQDFKRVMKSGKRLPSKSFILFSKKNKNQFHRLGIVVKKEVGLATYRNRVKRFLREFFRLHKDQIKGSFDLVILVKKGCKINRYKQAEEELRRLFPLIFLLFLRAVWDWITIQSILCLFNYNSITSYIPGRRVIPPA